MENLIFSLNATVPVFLMMVLGFGLRRVGLLDDAFAAKLNKLVFVVALPVLLFNQLSKTDFVAAWDTKFVLFCFGATLLSIGICFVIARLLCKAADRGEFVQAAYRSSAAILGIAYTQNIYGDAGMSPLMIIGSVPLYNIMAVVVLSVSADAGSDHKAAIAKTLRGIVTNPIILGIIAGLAWSLTGVTMPNMVDKTLTNVGNLATPLGLLALGASIRPEDVKGKLKLACCTSFMKLVGLCCVFLPVAVQLGFRDAKLVAIMVMLSSPTTVSSFVMARNMGHDGTLTANAVVLSTVLSAFTLTFWIWLLRSLGLI